jgi:hypothetical protein
MDDVLRPMLNFLALLMVLWLGDNLILRSIEHLGTMRYYDVYNLLSMVIKKP